MARLTTAERNALPSSDFAIPSERKYPEEDAGHAKAALARAGEYGTPAVKAKVRKKAAAKFGMTGKKGKSRMGPKSQSISERMLGED
jgi:hypothetical protein